MKVQLELMKTAQNQIILSILDLIAIDARQPAIHE